jgi:hypothetical protein
VFVPTAKRACFILALFAAAPREPARCTTLILQFRNDRAVKRRVIVVADSLGNFQETRPPRVEMKCKIATQNRVVFAFSGPVRSVSQGYDAYGEMRRAIAGPGSFAQRIRVFQAHMLDVLNNLENTSKSLEVVAVDAEHFPRYYLGVFAADEEGVWRIQPQSGIRETLPYEVKYVILGLRDHIAVALSTTPRPFDDTEEGVLHLLELEEKTHPDVVGGETSILEINDGKIIWKTPGRCFPTIEGSPHEGVNRSRTATVPVQLEMEKAFPH